MKFRFLSAVVVLAASLSAHSAFADEIATFTGSVPTTAPTQLGRPSRNGIPQTWTGAESYPGVLASTVNTTYYYQTYTFSNSTFNPNNYVDISIFDEMNSGLFFVSAYAGSYNPNARNQNWLGDEGSSGNIKFSNNPADLGDARFFDVIVPNGQDLVLVVNTTGGGTSGTGYKYDIAINSFSDSDYNTLPVTPYVAPTPEPSTFIELGTGVLAFAGFARRRFARA